MKYVLQNLNFSVLSGKDRSVVIRYAGYLSNLLISREDKALEDYIWVLNIFSEYFNSPAPDKKTLLSIYSNLNGKYMDKSPVAAMLCFETEAEVIPDSDYHLIKAISLLVSVFLVTHGSDIDEVININRRTRLLLNSRDSKLRAPLRKISKRLETTLPRLCRLYSQLMDKNSERFNSQIGKKLAQVISAVEKMLYLNNDKKNSKGKSFSSKKTYRKVEYLAASRQDTHSFKFDVIIDTISSSRRAEYGEPHCVEDSADIKDIIVRDTIHSSLASSKSIKTRITRGKVHGLIKGFISPISSPKHLTRRELEIITSSLFNPESKAQLDIQKTLLSFMLLFGRNYEASCKTLSKNTLNHSERIVFLKSGPYLAVKVELPAHRFTKLNKEFVIPVEETFYLSIPKELHRGILLATKSTFNSLYKNNVAIKASLKQLNEENRASINQGKIIRFLRHTMKMSGVDKLSIEYILNTSARQSITKYYRTVSASSLNDRYIEQIKEVASSNNVQLSFNPPINQKQLVGSFLHIKPEKVEELFSLPIDYFLRAARNTLSEIRMFHDHYTVFTFLILSLGTGIRKINSPFDSLANFDLSRKVVRINDKDNRSQENTRLLPLPDSCVKQLQFYLAHLKELRSILKMNFNPLYKEVDTILTSESPLLLFFSPNALKEVRTKRLERYFEFVWPLPLNWARHFMSDFLSASNLPNNLVRIWLGHEEFGEETFGLYSGVGFYELEQIRDKLNYCFDKLKIQPVKGL